MNTKMKQQKRLKTLVNVCDGAEINNAKIVEI